MQYAPFARDIITKQGNKANWLYILAYGEAEVLYEPRRRAGVLGMVHAGEFFGEMALITGDARTATVVAKTDVECLPGPRLVPGAAARRAEISEEIKRVAGGRRGDLEQCARRFPTRTRRRSESASGKIRRFFGMRP